MSHLPRRPYPPPTPDVQPGELAALMHRNGHPIDMVRFYGISYNDPYLSEVRTSSGAITEINTRRLKRINNSVRIALGNKFRSNIGGRRRSNRNRSRRTRRRQYGGDFRSFISLIYAGDIESIKRAIDAEPNIVNEVGTVLPSRPGLEYLESKTSPLIQAIGFYIGQGNPILLDIINLLLDRGADPNLVIPRNEAPLTAAITYNPKWASRSLEIVRLLLERGATPNLNEMVYPDDRIDNIPILKALHQGRGDILYLLILNGGTINSENPDSLLIQTIVDGSKYNKTIQLQLIDYILRLINHPETPEHIRSKLRSRTETGETPYAVAKRMGIPEPQLTRIREVTGGTNTNRNIYGMTPSKRNEFKSQSSPAGNPEGRLPNVFAALGLAGGRRRSRRN